MNLFLKVGRLRRVYALQLIALSALLLMAHQAVSDRSQASKRNLPLPSRMAGVYEASNAALPQPGLNMSHGFFSLADRQILSKLRFFLSQCKQAGTVPLVSLEPFVEAPSTSSPGQLLSDMESGKYDDELIHIGQVLLEHPQPIILRFAHEMDVPSQYPWYYKNPADYTNLYRLVHRKLSAIAGEKLIWMWSPQGRQNANRYWPGNDVVDLIGLSIYASSAWNPSKQLESFATIYQQKEWLGSLFKRPIIAAEVGVSGTSKQQEAWIKEAINAYSKLNGLRGLVYFNAAQPVHVPIATGWENWQLQPPVRANLRLLLP